MKKLRLVSLLLCLVALISLCCVSAVAEEQQNPAIFVVRSLSNKDTKPDNEMVKKMIEEQSGVKFEIIAIPTANWDEKINALIASGEPVDIINISEDSGNWSQYFERHAIVPLDGLLEEYCPNIIARAEESAWKCGTAGDGAVYAIPRQEAFAHGHTPIFRQDWLDALGAEVPKTLEDLEALFEQVSPDMETAMKAVSGGFTSVMVDFSSLPFEENVRRTAEVVRYCHAMGIDVEGEVGHVGSGMNEADYLDEAGYTRPETAVEYVKRTGVDQLAVAIGTAHGNYKASPKLDLERLDKIREAIDIPLVLHGGSGVPHDQLREAFKRGICKLNIATDYNQYIYHCVKNLVRGDNADKKRMSDCIKEARPLAKEYIRNLIRMGNGKN